MNGKIQGIIVCGVIIGCLGGMLAFLNATGGADKKDESSSEVIKTESVDESVMLVEKDTIDIKSISAQNEYGGFTMERPASGKTEWNIAELTGLDQSTYAKSRIAENAAQIKAYRTVEQDAADLSKYGLDEPTGSFTIGYKDGTSRTFLIGDVSTKTRYRYLCEEGDDTVYMVLVSLISEFIEPVENLVDTTLIAQPPDSEMPDYGKLTLSRKDLDYDMVFEQDDSDSYYGVSAQVMTEPVFSYLNITGSSATTHGMWGLTAKSAVKLFPKEEDFAQYGLDDPIAEVTFVGEGYDYDLKIGGHTMKLNEDGNETADIDGYYCYLTGVDGVDCIWLIDAQNVPWATVMPGDVISMAVNISILNINSMTVTNGGEKAEYILDTDGESEIYSVKKNGADVDVSLFQDFYKYLLSCPTDEIYFEEIDGEPYLSIDIDFGDDGQVEELDFYTDSSRRTLVEINGRPSYRIPTSWTERFISNMENLDNGEKIIETY